MRRTWCTALEAAHRLGLPLATVQRLLQRGVLESQRVGRQQFVKVESVETWAVHRRGCGIR
jgi:excisionase family DNA binding protein